jgi:peptide/nickel transport system substrate-binding protein
MRKLFVLLVAISIIGLGVAPCSMAAAQRKLVIAIGEEPSGVDQTASWTGVDFQITENYGEYIIYRAPNGDLKPGLAASWKVSPDGKEMEITLRKGVKFHSGDPLTAKDIVFSYERGREKSSTAKTKLASLEKIDILDDYRLKFYFKAPDVTFIPNRGGTMIASKTYFDKVGEEKFSKEPVGTGPYKFVSYALGEYVDLERFKDYWGEKPPVAEARLLFVPEDTTRLSKLKAGEVDLINACPYTDVKDLEKNPAFKIVKLPVDHPTLSVVFSILNPKVPWHDRKVRLAMAHAVDGDAIVKNVLFGIPDRWPFLAPHEVGYDATLKHYPYDPKKAKQLLAEAGYPQGFDLKLYYATTGRVQMNKPVAEAVTSYFEAVGIRTQLIGEEWLAYRSRYNAAKGPEAEYAAVFTHGRSGSPDPTYNMSLFFSKGGGISMYSNPELDKINAEAKATVNDAKRAELIKKAVRVIYEDVPSFPIYNNVAVYAMKKDVNFTPTKKYNMDLTLIKDMSFK